MLLVGKLDFVIVLSEMHIKFGLKLESRSSILLMYELNEEVLRRNTAKPCFTGCGGREGNFTPVGFLLITYKW